MKDYNEIINKYYPADTLRRAIYLKHCAAVANLALEITHHRNLPLAYDVVMEAGMLHDIGIFLTDAPDIGCHGAESYIRHGLLGASLLRAEGYPEEIARVAERHTGAGITAAEVRQQNLPLPMADYMPETLLERLICYADKFYSKSGDMEQKPYDKVIRSMQRISDATLRRFLKLNEEFGITSEKLM